MIFPFVSRSHHEEIVGELKQQLAERDRDLRMILKNHFGLQFEEVQAQPKEAVPEPEITIDSEEAQDQRRLAAIRRTNPSRLGQEMTRLMQKRAMRMAAAAHPVRTVNARASAIFEKARTEAMN